MHITYLVSNKLIILTTTLTLSVSTYTVSYLLAFSDFNIRSLSYFFLASKISLLTQVLWSRGTNQKTKTITAQLCMCVPVCVRTCVCRSMCKNTHRRMHLQTKKQKENQKKFKIRRIVWKFLLCLTICNFNLLSRQLVFQQFFLTKMFAQILLKIFSE